MNPRRVQVLIVAALTTIAIGFVAFVLARPEPTTFVPSKLAHSDSTGALVLTIDATNPDRWTFASLEDGAVTQPGQPWDIAVRRFHIITNGGPGFSGRGGAAELDPEDPGAQGSTNIPTLIPTTADSTHPVLSEWYRYGFASHLLSPRDVSFAVATRTGRIAKLRILSYYCPGPIAGCLTIRYVFPDHSVQ